MKKIMLIGELSDVLRSINDGLSEEFNVQICASQIDVIKGMIKVVRPDLVLYCQPTTEEVDSVFFEWMQRVYPYLPVLVISTEKEWRKIEPFCIGSRFYHIYRPVTVTRICEKCFEIMEPDKAAEGSKENELYAEDSGKKKIMIVDDNPLVLRNMKGMLESQYEVFVAPSGRDALNLIPKKKPDLVLLDYMMAGMDGREVFETMLEDSYMSTIPVIFLTGVMEKDMVIGVLKSLPAGYIVKPADRDRLLEEIEKVLYNM